jgi:TRAP-type C4-dicarboxylate transport system permease large subunit
VDIYKSIVPFAILMMITLAIIMVVPDIALWLPDLYSHRAR